MKKFLLLFVISSSLLISQTIPFQYGWPRQGADDWGLYNSSPTVDDINRDGSLDVSVTEVMASYPGTPRINVWQKNGAFVPGFPAFVPFGSLQSSGSNEISAMGNVDNDEFLELVYGDENGKIYIFKANGQQAPGSPIDVGATKESTTPALVDLDGDSVCEIIITSFERDSPGDNAQLHVFTWKGTGFDYFSGFPINFGLGSDSSPVVGDLDNDGSYEIVFTSNGRLSDSTMSLIHVVKTDGSYFPGFPYEVSYSTLGATPALYDLNRNGRLEIVIRMMPSRTGINGIYAIDYQGNLLPGYPFPIESGNPTANVAIADMNGDGWPEIAYGSVRAVDSGKVFVWDLQGNILPGFPQKIWATWVDGSVAIADVSGDGLSDVIVPTSKGFIYAFKHDGSIVPGFPLEAENVYVVKGFNTSPTVVDIDGDGDIEIFAASLNKRVYGYDTPGLASAPIWSTFKGNAQRTGGMLRSPYPLPVELSSFSAAVSGTSITLSWITATETNNNGFEIQRKEKNEEEWTVISFVKGNGTTTSVNHYTYEDNFPKEGVFSYRLNQVDYDGTNKYYYLNMEVSAEMPQSFDLSQNYPNPFNPETIIKYTIAEESFVVIRVYDILGKEAGVIVNQSMKPGSYEVRLNASDYNLSSGVYFYTMKAGNFTSIKKMIITK
jgi:hypothetical protein